ncbi:MAG: PilZ domain-containing protein [Thermodesulfobacteriota bacterium]|nr:PilZ domain-containing protein [Thermodesulfobacteriota bacterium]
MAEDGRTLKRRHLIYYLEVFNENNDELLGHVVDITTKGIKLIGKHPIKSKQEFSLHMKLPEEYSASGLLKFDAVSLWSNKDVNPDFMVTGFQTLNLDKEAAKTIKKLINLLGFND